jgi:hypothetical protein
MSSVTLFTDHIVTVHCPRPECPWHLSGPYDTSMTELEAIEVKDSYVNKHVMNEHMTFDA